MEERRGTSEHKYGVTCKWLTPRQQVRVAYLIARLKSLAWLDTRVFSLFCGTVNIVWFFAVMVPVLTHQDPDLVGFLARVVAVVPIEYIAGPVLVMGITEIFCALFNVYYCRVIVAFVSVFWWSWLAAVAYIDPVNETAALLFIVMTVFRAWSMITINFTHPKSVHYHDIV